MNCWLQYLFGLACLASTARATCNRRPQGASGDRSPVDENLKLLIDGNPSTYIPGQQYNISLSCMNGLKFTSFTLVVESATGVSSGYDMLGHFEIIDTAETRFSLSCENMIESTNTNTKSRIDVTWVAPTNPESECVLLKAAVLQHRSVWFIDDGFLTKRFCPEEIDDVNTQTPRVNPCCACDDAKYEILIKRNWSRNTHAKDYPSESWRTRFSEVVGASHTYDYRFWEYGTPASRGLQELAEHGATVTLETEIKQNSNINSIRTIIRAPGIVYRNNVVSTTLAHVRVDPRHHLISLVSKIDPSPDWILGVAGVELCLINCTWIELKVLNMYPWDIGTDAGPTYMSPDQPQLPPDVVRRITSTFPSDYRSPFYDDSGAPMKPLATLYITRKKLYERDCDLVENVSLECATHPWNDWSECSAKCGAGTQQRVRAYKDSRLAESFNCQVLLSESQNCMGNQCGLSEDDTRSTPLAECELTRWGAWSQCSKRCGKGHSTRTRDYVNVYARERCQSGFPIELEQRRDCDGEHCGGAIHTHNDGDENRRIFGNFDEPGLLEGNSFPNNRFSFEQNQNFRNFDTNNNNGYDEFPEAIDAPFDNERNADFNNDFSNSRFGSFDNSRPNLPRAPQEHFNSRENSYRKEHLVGEAPHITADDRSQGNYQRNKPHLQSQAIDYTTRNPVTIFNRPAEQSDTRFNQHRAGTQPNMGQGAARSPTTYPPANRSPNAPHSYLPTKEPFDRDQAGLREEYDEHGRKTIMVGSMDPSNYDVIQEYCFEKPFASERSCKKGKSISNYWFYDADDRECKIFTADLCDENKNKFRTLEACEGTCHRPQQNLEETLSQENSWSSDGSFAARQPQSESQRRSHFSGRENQRRTFNHSWM